MSIKVKDLSVKLGSFKTAKKKIIAKSISLMIHGRTIIAKRKKAIIQLLYPNIIYWWVWNLQMINQHYMKKIKFDEYKKINYSEKI